jgi:hypothetical protein
MLDFPGICLLLYDRKDQSLTRSYKMIIGNIEGNTFKVGLSGEIKK